ncbi:MAG: aminopeptidase P family protein [Gemmatimonadaceae bacterium]|nr:aminopeptidase P family protein [Gemmatimonadaceae bacterium]
MASRRTFVREIGASIAAASLASEALAAEANDLQPRGSERLLVDNPHHPAPAPVGVDRLALSWYKARSQVLRERARARGAHAVLLQSDVNLVYFTGCFRGSGERTTWALMPVDERDTVYWFSPAIDRDLITSWWATENDYYFCYPHAEGGFPNRGELARGNRVDLWAWVLGKLGARGLGDRTIALDRELGPSAQRTWERVLPSAKAIDISDECLRLQVIKTPEEIALTQRAYRYFDKVHAFARDYILEHGTRTTDYQIGQALASYGINLMMRDVRRDGKPHSAVGMEVTGNYVRTGVATAYPHPNQFFHARVERGKPLYVNCDILLGGYGGEGYRNYILLPSTQQHDRMWQVVADTVQMITEETKPGAVCSEIAYKVHAYQIKQGMQEFIYHRPGHGQGQNFVGHQPPFLALGDDTVVEEGMTFSVEPGLYDEASGIGINPSDRLVVLRDRAVLMSRIPFSREWSYLRV